MIFISFHLNQTVDRNKDSRFSGFDLSLVSIYISLTSFKAVQIWKSKSFILFSLLSYNYFKTNRVLQ